MFALILGRVLRSRITPYVVVFALGIGMGVWQPWHRAPQVTIIHEPGNVTMVKVPGETLPAETITKYVKDTTEVAKLLAQQAALKNQVAQLTETLAKLSTTGNGPVQTTVTPTSPTEGQVTRLTFKDWRLNFTSDMKTADYTLNQQFEILTMSGKTPAGQPTFTAKLFEIGPGETRTAAEHVSTTVVVADPLTPHWMTRLRVQAGAGMATGSHVGAVLVAQFLAHGRSAALEDTQFAVASPAMLLTSDGPAFGVLPVSYNVGSLRRPFTNVWVSPLIALKTGKTIFGGAVTATF